MSKPVKKALLVGLNKYHPSLNADLRGCVNDVKHMYDLLVQIYKFPADNVRVICDERATKGDILGRLKWLVENAPAGSELVFQYSGHGSQVRDRNGDELNDGLDEILCPYDLDWNLPLTDDIIAGWFRQVNPKAYLTMICDACHSGTMTRGGLSNPDLETHNHSSNARYLQAPFDVGSRALGRELPTRKIGKHKKGEVKQKHVLLSGCKDNQTSADAYINNRYQGAMTYSFLTSLAKNRGATWKEVYSQLYSTIKKMGFSQKPQLSGMEKLLNRKVFGGV